MKCLLVICLFFCVAVDSQPCAAKDNLWNFTTEAQMKAVIPQYINNPRATYYIIQRAYHHKMAGQATVVYHDLMRLKPNDPKTQAAYAFCHFMATGPLSGEYFVYGASPLTRGLRKQQIEANDYRLAALQTAPKSPEILLESALPIFYTSAGTPEQQTPQRQKAINLLRKATRLAPQWADAHYWLAVMLSDSWTIMSSQKTALGQESITELHRAEELNPTLHTDCLLSYLGAYQALDKPDKALLYLDAYVRAKPEEAKRMHLIEGRAALLKQMQSKG